MKNEALTAIRRFHDSVKFLNIEDEMNYYAYCNTFYMRHLKDYHHSLAVGDSMISLLRKTGYLEQLPSRHIQALNVKADALMALGLYADAYDNFYKAKNLASATSDSCSLSRYNYSLAMLLYRQHKFQQSADLFKLALTETSACSSDFAFFYRRQEMMDNIALCYYKVGKYDSALNYYHAALEFISQHRGDFPERNDMAFESAKAVIYGNMGDVYVANNKLDTARELFLKSVGINIQKGFSNEDAQLTQIKLGKLYYRQQKQEELKALLEQIRAELDTLPDVFVQKEYYMLMWKYAARANNLPEAYRYLERYTASNDSFTHIEERILPFDIVGRLQALESQYEN
ncbi:MAG: hypothetical protein EBZ77_15685, partial [Chitinophagia bacterium]|nr:hypothetical protein [Chitinophagia bacterium]